MKKLLAGLFILVSTSAQAVEVKSQNFSFTLDDKEQTVVFDATKRKIIFKGEEYLTHTPENDKFGVKIEGDNSKSRDKEVFLFIFKNDKARDKVFKRYGSQLTYENEKECKDSKAVITFVIRNTDTILTTCLR